eukprot:scaffold147790_cov29-Tisochrysis_lutea.AAC.2
MSPSPKRRPRLVLRLSRTRRSPKGWSIKARKGVRLLFKEVTCRFVCAGHGRAPAGGKRDARDASQCPAHLARVDKDGVIRAIAHQVGVAYVVLHQPSAKDEHAGTLGLDS